MESSLRYAGDSKSLVIHAKEKFPLNTFTHLQGHAELDTKIGAPTYLCAMIRQYFPDVCSYPFYNNLLLVYVAIC
ncbi:outer envelope pore protein 21B, chloroplastic isoform X5 [Solanum pennellii]|uniref:Outer envelope pore protein 21B, chloroplastic isoform X5 n=1 Tax=Solanum pennellii TaxID=28526 RepID=A0ABM1V9U9_SOLPN|nr:outer envelope pore protein 21B, chloroplastic isoform X5 [Solanum pennellii]